MLKYLVTAIFVILIAGGWFIYRYENPSPDKNLGSTPHALNPQSKPTLEQPHNALSFNDDALIRSSLSSFAPSEDDKEEIQLFQATAANHSSLLYVTQFIVLSNNSQPSTRPTLSEKQATDWIRVLYRDALLASYLRSDLSDLQRQKAENWLNQPDAPLEPSLLVVGPHLSVNYLQRVKKLLSTQNSIRLESEQARQRLIPELMDMTKRRKRLSDNYMKRWLRPYLENAAVPLEDKIALGREFRATQDRGLLGFTTLYMEAVLKVKQLDEKQIAMINNFLSELKK